MLPDIMKRRSRFFNFHCKKNKNDLGHYLKKVTVCLSRRLSRRLNLGGDSQRLWPGSRRWGRRGWVLPAYRTSSRDSPAPTLEEAEEEKGPISSRFSRARGGRWKQPTTGPMSNGNTHDLETVFAQPLARKTSHVTWSPSRRPVWFG